MPKLFLLLHSAQLFLPASPTTRAHFFSLLSGRAFPILTAKLHLMYSFHSITIMPCLTAGSVYAEGGGPSLRIYLSI